MHGVAMFHSDNNFEIRVIPVCSTIRLQLNFATTSNLVDLILVMMASAHVQIINPAFIKLKAIAAYVKLYNTCNMISLRRENSSFEVDSAQENKLSGRVVCKTPNGME